MLPLWNNDEKELPQLPDNLTPNIKEEATPPLGILINHEDIPSWRLAQVAEIERNYQAAEEEEEVEKIKIKIK